MSGRSSDRIECPIATNSRSCACSCGSPAAAGPRRAMQACLPVAQPGLTLRWRCRRLRRRCRRRRAQTHTRPRCADAWLPAAGARRRESSRSATAPGARRPHRRGRAARATETPPHSSSRANRTSMRDLVAGIVAFALLVAAASLATTLQTYRRRRRQRPGRRAAHGRTVDRRAAQRRRPHALLGRRGALLLRRPHRSTRIGSPPCACSSTARRSRR